MKIYLNILSILALIFLAGCSENDEIIDPSGDEYVYSFTAVLGEPQSRVSYHEDSESKNLKMVWDEGDIIRLYPDASMNDPKEYYEFVANTGKGTQRTVFVHQGYIPNWEHWSGKAIYVFPNGDNLNVEANSEYFKTKFQIQTSNNNTDHLKYAEHVLGEDGSIQYREYWSDHLEDYNLKHDHEMYFNHPHTVVYKLMLRGFIYDIPGGSVLKVRGASWPEGEISLKLGYEEDEEPFLNVGEFGRPGYNDSIVLTAYIIRQVSGDTDGSIKKGEKLKIELLSYDKDDGTAYPLVAEDKQTHRRSKVDANGYGYFVNQPWGDEYTWEITASADIDYNVGDYVVADLTDLNKSANYPRIAMDLGMPRKWAAYNVGAKKPDDYGRLFVWGYTISYPIAAGQVEKPTFPETVVNFDTWTPGHSEYDPATLYWGNKWTIPTENEAFDLVYYCRIINEYGAQMELKEGLSTAQQWEDTDGRQVNLWNIDESCFFSVNDIKFCRLRSTLNDRYFSWPMSGAWNVSEVLVPGSIGCFYTYSWHHYSSNNGPTVFLIRSTGLSSSLGLSYNATKQSNKKAGSHVKVCGLYVAH